MTRALLGGVIAASLLLLALHVHGLFAWALCIPMVLTLRPQPSWRHAGALGVTFGTVVALLGSAPSVVAAGQRYFGLPFWQAASATGAMALICGGLWGLGLGLTLRGALALPGGWSIAACGAVWVTAESVLLSVLPKYPWFSVAATQVDSPTLVQVAAIGGQSLVTYTVTTAGTVLGLALEPAIAAQRRYRRALLGVGIFIASLGFGWTRLATGRPGATACTVATVDAQIHSPHVPRQDVQQRYAILGDQARASHASVIVWPESALPASPETDGALRRHLQALVHGWNTPLVAGGPRTQWSSQWQPQLLNSAYFILPNGTVTAYDKRRLVPFAEYWPRGLGQRPAWLSTAEATAGRLPGIFAIDGCRLGILVCFEAEYPPLAWELTRQHTDALLVLSNDAQLPEQMIANEVAAVRLRALETGGPVIRAANAGRSVVADRFGQITQQMQGGVLTVPVPRIEPALAVYLGPIFSAFCWITTAAIAGGATVRQSWPRVGH